MRPLLILCFSFVLNLSVQGNDLYPLKINPFLRKYISQKGYVYPLNGTRYSFLDLRPWSDDFKAGGQQLIRTDSNLYVFVQSTSRLYKAVLRDSLYIHFQRIDSTLAQFYNIGSYQFTVGEDLYSYGGYGFWKNNGLLRRFNFKQGEWDIVPLDREIIAQSNPSSLVWYDAANRQLHVPFQQFINEGVKQIRHNIGEIEEGSWVLDLKTMKWEERGRVNPQVPIASERANPEIQFSNVNGIIIESLNQLIIMDYRRNTFVQTGIHTVTQMLNRNVQLYDLNFLIGDTIFFLNTGNGKMDTSYIGGLPIMESLHIVENSNRNLILAVCLLVFGLGLLIVIRRRNHSAKQINNFREVDTDNPITFGQGDFPKSSTHAKPDRFVPQSETPQYLFNATEINVIMLCLQHSEKGGFARLEEINHVLGIKNKSKGLQKKVRSEVFNSINDKFNVMTKSTAGLIESVRNKNDKRYFDYFIDSDNFEKVRHLLKTDGES